MKFAILALFLLVVTLPARGQASDSETATITADVVAALGIAKNQDLSFGDVAQNTASTIQVTDGAAVKFSITGEPGKNVTFTLTSPANLSDGGGNTVTFNDDIQYNAADDPAAGNVLNDGATIALNGTGNLYVYLGGTVTAAVAQATGAYSATYVVQVDY